MLTLERAKELNDTMVTEPHLKVHALSVSAAMRAMGQHFDENAEHWAAVVICTIMIMKSIPRSTCSTQRSLCGRREWTRTKFVLSSATATVSARTWRL